LNNISSLFKLWDFDILDAKVKRTLSNIATKFNILYLTCTGNAFHIILFQNYA